jgi:ABC-2 type transport system ATP-binding protein
LIHDSARVEIAMDTSSVAPTTTSHQNSSPTLAISVDHLSKTYPVSFVRLKQFFGRKSKPPVEALRDVSIGVKRGEIFGLIGRNGAGKTTLTKIIATLVQPTTGAVSVNGFDSVSEDQAVRAQVGLAGAEERSFYWRLTGEENLLFFARLYGMNNTVANARIDELFEQFDLQESARRRFGELSTGNKQRLAVARALLSRPPVLLLDEPTRSLDPLAAARMRELIASLAHSNPPATVLLTSHNLGEVETLCDRVAIISRGEIKAIDSPRNLRAVNSNVERIHAVVIGIDGVAASMAVAGAIKFLHISPPHEAADDSLFLSFDRERGDQQLDLFVGLIQKHGGIIQSIDTERPTLLDVLERYENEEAPDGARGLET